MKTIGIMFMLCGLLLSQSQTPIPASGSIEALRYVVDDSQLRMGMFPSTYIYVHPSSPSTTAIRFTIRVAGKPPVVSIVPVQPVPTGAPTIVCGWGSAAVGGIFLAKWNSVESVQLEELQVTAVHQLAGNAN